MRTGNLDRLSTVEHKEASTLGSFGAREAEMGTRALFA